MNYELPDDDNDDDDATSKTYQIQLIVTVQT
jgi:hypothetical protein